MAIAGLEVLEPRTTSSRRITLAGEKKCMPTTASGRETAVAISFTSSADVLVANTAPCLTILSSLPNTSFLIAMVSNAASMIRSQSANAFQSMVPVNRPIRFSTSSIVKRPRLAEFS